jgi:hypothetical protein
MQIGLESLSTFESEYPGSDALERVNRASFFYKNYYAMAPLPL